MRFLKISNKFKGDGTYAILQSRKRQYVLNLFSFLALWKTFLFIFKFQIEFFYDMNIIIGSLNACIFFYTVKFFFMIELKLFKERKILSLTNLNGSWAASEMKKQFTGFEVSVYLQQIKIHVTARDMSKQFPQIV
jgi:hypothetical protein